MKAAAKPRLWLTSLALALLMAGCTFVAPPPVSPTPPPSPVEGTLAVHFLDIGQGDATLVRGPDFTMLIDAGRHNANDVVPHLEHFGVERLDILVGTHPHADHIGQMDRVLARFPVGEVWMSGHETTTATYERVLDAIAAAMDADPEMAYHEPRAGEVYDFGAVSVNVIHPIDLSGSLDDNSVSLRVAFGEVAFIFTGDAGTRAEQSMIDRGEPLAATVLQLGHHGSRTSSGQPFLEAVAPEIAIWSAGIDNSFGHPHPEVVERLACLDIAVFGTADHGTISAYTDGRELRLEVDLPNGARGPPVPVPAHCSTPGGNGNEVIGCAPGQVDINRADVETLQAIVHIGPERAQMLIALRPYTSLDDMRRIPGIGPGLLTAIVEQGVACVGATP
jgi:competence protein ComEC